MMMTHPPQQQLQTHHRSAKTATALPQLPMPAAVAAAAADPLAGVAVLDCPQFDFEPYVAKEFALSLSLQKAAVCRAYLRGFCPRGEACPARHPQRGKTVVCKHWLRGLCKKGDACEFLHEYNLRKMPECWFFSKYRECSNAECIYLHIDPAAKVRECHDYARGFCRLGPACKHKHVRRPLCALYLTGFCPHGADCLAGHPKLTDAPPAVYEMPIPAMYGASGGGQA